jgi:dipeptidyl aminopeptidase/acylaminoacyl peptidase
MKFMHLLRLLAAPFLLLAAVCPAQVPPPDSLVLDGVPEIPAALKQKAEPYLEFRAASFNGWHPTHRELLITTRFAETPQLHFVSTPLGARHQLTFSPEPVAGGSFQPRAGKFIVFAQDVGGGEFFQLYRYDPESGQTMLLTDGKSRNMGARWSRSGKWIAYTSTRRTGRDTDIWLINPAQPETDRLLHQVSGGGWSVQDWSHDESQLLLENYISINESHLFLLDIKTGQLRPITPASKEAVAWSSPRFSRNDRSIFVTTDRGSEFRQLAEFPVPARGATFIEPLRVLSRHIAWNIDELELSFDGQNLAFVANENGLGVLRILDVKSGKERRMRDLPRGIISNIRWHENGRDLGFDVASAQTPTDVFSLDVRTGTVQRWTRSETGGLNASRFVQPRLVTFPSFDQLEISAFVYYPDPQRFPGKRPALISIHGGPESQSRPGFQARNNYYVNELGLVLVVPNVRGSSGYGKTFLTLDNADKREDSVRDIGALLQFLKTDSRIDRNRMAVMGGSYGGYMVLASLIHFGDQLRCGVDVVGISNFLTFLKNTQDYRRDLRRAEYGDERDPAMAAFLEKISPTANVSKLQKPLLVIQGQNDPRVPVTESEQMVQAIRQSGGAVWYLMAKDEGHGFRKKRNADFQFLTTILFLEKFLVH